MKFISECTDRGLQNQSRLSSTRFIFCDEVASVLDEVACFKVTSLLSEWSSEREGGDEDEENNVTLTGRYAVFR